MNYISWSLVINNTAFKEVRPLKMELIKEVEYERLAWWDLFRQPQGTYTGRHIIRFMYDKGPGTSVKMDDIVFNDYKIAKHWFDTTFQSVFIGKTAQIPPPPPPAKKPVTPKDSKGLRVVK